MGEKDKEGVERLTLQKLPRLECQRGEARIAVLRPVREAQPLPHGLHHQSS
jgi:hypothetical protein